ncbi:hypothetical protein [Leptolyngbya ohadii]|uniref:hypothetical protein n=1 Tax=Leptolyngbya ohadii TaxID=1962290 RepID=UPI000B59ED90|nr:hypothetical protein [Leptolyngbya ohadii]
MNSRSQFDQVHPTGADSAWACHANPESHSEVNQSIHAQPIHAIGRSIAKVTNAWHPYWIGVATLGTFALVGLEAVLPQNASAQNVVVAADFSAAIVPSTDAQLEPLEPNLQSATAGTVDLEAVDLEAVDSGAMESEAIPSEVIPSEVIPSEAIEFLAIKTTDQPNRTGNDPANDPTTNLANDPADDSTNDSASNALANDEVAPSGETFSVDQVALPNHRNDSIESRTADRPAETSIAAMPLSCLENCPVAESHVSVTRLTVPLQIPQIESSPSATSFLTAPSFESKVPTSAASPDALTNLSNPPANAPSLPDREPSAGTQIAQGGSALLGAPFVQLQGAIVVQGDEFSARARTTVSYAITPNLLVGGTLDLVTGDAFTDSPESGLNLNELYVAVSPSEIPTLRFAVGLLDYTSYFDRNSFAKDGVTQFFNPIFQTNPALAAAGLSSRPGLLVNWSVTDNFELRAAGFSSRRDLGDFALDGFAAEAAVRVQNLIVRGTFVTAEDAGDDSGFREIFQFDRGSGDFGLRSGDREQAYGISAEYFVPSIRLGLFGRYGWYDNLDLGRGGETFSFGFNFLDLLMLDDRLGLAYGRDLSDEGLRKQRGDDLADVVEVFYDARLLPNLRAGITAQARNSFSETILGFRVRADFSLSDLGRIFR